ncbi:putative bifunctional diguanylate cyclase/phosphodiesterase [Halovibrio sp. HP20-50]|uniref:putative bifunctional diguanylate cyclase/phosphodiesterase n=1 Tax=Halovibrio sp. HP20-59 TaxID=3080275 RepID=UPI00294AB4EB|nr:EAL domain-containing protein [Halovibrio sp. HP20-59]MEA2117558.1 EAL domain-containing protein [Halovibrio sp. HP20-59]
MNNLNEMKRYSLSTETNIAQYWLHRLLEPAVLFSGIAVMALGVIWATTLNLANREQVSAERTAAALAMDIADTYEAQIVRALREIDTTLKLVLYSLDGKSAPSVLDDLRARGMLPPEVLFTVNVTDSLGNVLASTEDLDTAQQGVATHDYYRFAQQTEGMVVGMPRFDQESNDWELFFSRRAQGRNEGAAIIVTVSVHAGYFVSSYEPDVLGEQGVLALVGNDGIFRVRRTGTAISANRKVDYETMVAVSRDVETPAKLTVNAWDEILRYTVARELFEFPLAIVVGLSEAERLAAVKELEQTYLWRAMLASLLLLIIVILLGRLSWKLQRAQFHNMEQRVAHAQRVEYLAFHDSLTGLPNRAFFSQLLTQGMNHSRRYTQQFALLFLDLDRFKMINDSLGHDAGDELLQEMGRRLNGAVRESDVVARLGGDEFVVLLPKIEAIRQAEIVAEKVLSTVSAPFTLAGQELHITVSIGVALFPKDGEDEQSLLKSADIAMYYAKEKGKNNVQFSSKALNADSLERFALESNLRSALQNQEFKVYYQSKQDMNGRVTGMEALLRWQHPDLGLVAPMEFIPMAEENGLIIPIGRWVLKTACWQNVAWQNEGFPELSMGVNLSARQFLDKGLLDDIKTALHETGMAPELLELEITESMVMYDVEQTVQILKKIKKMGVRVAIDDFGTGYSSLSRLKDFPLDSIKIDGSFIYDTIDCTGNQKLTEAIIEIGRTLSLTVIAEGVETLEQLEYLRTISCDQFQGFYANKPLPPEEFAVAMREIYLAPQARL